MTGAERWDERDDIILRDRHRLYRVQAKAATRSTSDDYGDYWYAEWRDLTAPPPYLARIRAFKAIDEYLDEGLISSATADRGKAIVDDLFDRETVYSTVAPDNGGLVFYWRAGVMSIEIDVYESPDDGYWWRINNVAAVSESGHEPGKRSAQVNHRLAHSLKQFSKEVELVNPDWRKQQH